MMKITLYEIENDTGFSEGYFIKSVHTWDADTGPQKYEQYYVVQADGPPQEVLQNVFATMLNILDIQTLCVTVAEKEPK
jgi:hypothetical protein